MNWVLAIIFNYYTRNSGFSLKVFSYYLYNLKLVCIYIYTVTRISIGYILFSVITLVYVRYFAWKSCFSCMWKENWIPFFFLSKFKITLCKSIGYINLIFSCIASVLFHCFQSLSVVGHKFSTLIQHYFTPSSLHNSFNCLIFCGFRLWTLTFKVFHKFSIGFKLGDWLG